MKKRDSQKRLNDLVNEMIARTSGRGEKIHTFKVETEKPCRAQGCNGRIKTFDPVGFESGPNRMAVVCFCTKCHRLHNLDGSLVQCGAGKKAYLDKNGSGVIRDRNNKIVDRFWTSKSKPSKAKSNILVN